MEDPAIAEINERLDRIELAVAMMAQWLVQAGAGGFTAYDAEGVERILRNGGKISLRT